VIFACDVLEHIAEDTNALSQLFEALKHGWYCIITVPKGKSIWAETDVHAGHKRRYDRDEIIRKLRIWDSSLSEHHIFFLLAVVLYVLHKKKEIILSGSSYQNNDVEWAQ
jgi:hypothetical protein